MAQLALLYVTRSQLDRNFVQRLTLQQCSRSSRRANRLDFDITVCLEAGVELRSLFRSECALFRRLLDCCLFPCRSCKWDVVGIRV
jgi:hypothetical protein